MWRPRPPATPATFVNVERWLAENRIDAGAREVFLNIDSDHQMAIMADGHVRGCRNPSAALMVRIRSLVGYLPICRRGEAASSSEPASKRPRTASSTFSPGLEIALLIRGECSREGSRTEHRTTGSMQVFEANMRSVVTHMVQPLERKCRDLKVLVFADLMGDPGREVEAREILVRVFGKTLKEARLSQFLRGRDQVNSIMSSWDFCMQSLDVRGKRNTVTGVFVTRADIEYLVPSNPGPQTPHGFQSWPLDKLCFLWQVHYDCVWSSERPGCNDTVFFVPLALFEKFRDALADKNGDAESLHWCSQHPVLADHCWYEYNFSMICNTERMANPIYKMTSRKEGDLEANMGKFHQYWLQEVADSEARNEAASLLPAKKEAIWCRRVKELCDDFITKHRGNGMPVNLFVTQWSRRYPHDAVEWYMPEQYLLRSIEVCGEVERSRHDRNLVVWRAVPWRLKPRRSFCMRCETSSRRSWRTFYQCTRCSRVVCVMCGQYQQLHFMCDVCCLLPPWKR